MVSPVRASGSSVTAVAPLANILPCAVCWLSLDTAQDSMSRKRSSAHGGVDDYLVCNPRPAGPARLDHLRAGQADAADCLLPLPSSLAQTLSRAEAAPPGRVSPNC